MNNLPIQDIYLISCMLRINNPFLPGTLPPVAVLSLTEIGAITQ